MQITKSRLKKLRALISETAHLQAQYDDLICFPKHQVVDTAKDYRTGFPRTILLSGCGDAAYIELRQKLYDKQRQIQQEIAFLEDWLDSIPDPEMRDILRLQYVNGLTQEEIAAELGYARETVSRKLSAFWESNQSSH